MGVSMHPALGTNRSLLSDLVPNKRDLGLGGENQATGENLGKVKTDLRSRGERRNSKKSRKRSNRYAFTGSMTYNKLFGGINRQGIRNLKIGVKKWERVEPVPSGGARGISNKVRGQWEHSSRALEEKKTPCGIFAKCQSN